MKLLAMLLGSKPLLRQAVTSKLGFFGEKTSPLLSIPTLEKVAFNLPPIAVPKDRMRSLKHWPDDGSFELMFATKSGLPVPFCPINHSAIALRNHEDMTFSIYGRQSPWDVSNWRRDGISFRTRKGNELNYLSDGYTFTTYPTGAFLNKKEIAHCLDSANHLINEAQTCNMYNSNCYSYSTTVMSFAVETMLSRPHVDAKAISQLLKVMEEHPLTDNFSIGVLNNRAVTDKLSSVCSLVLKYTEALTKPSSEESELQAQVRRILERVLVTPPSKESSELLM